MSQLPLQSEIASQFQDDLAFLVRGECGSPVLDLDPDGRACYRSLDGECVSLCDPRLANYNRAVDDHQRRWLKGVWEPVHDRIADPDNDEPLPRAFMRKHPDTVAWIYFMLYGGQDPGYKPTRAEYAIIFPAFLERRRRVAERGPATGEGSHAPVGESRSMAGSAYSPKELRGIFGVSGNTLLKYAKLAGVTTPPKSGGRGFRYPQVDVTRIARTMVTSSDSLLVNRCRQWLQQVSRPQVS